MKWTLQRLSTNSGYLQDCPIEFAPGLNCIIGARGTCKSTVIETIRFAFDCEPDKIEPMIVPPGASGTSTTPFARTGLLHETLVGGTAKCAFFATDDPSQSSFVVERSMPGPTRVYRDGVQQIEDVTLLHRIEIFSQGDLQSVAERPDRRLALIDRPNQKRVAELSERLHEVTSELKALGPQIRKIRGDLESRQAKIQSLAPARKQLSELQASRPSLSPQLEAERLAFDNRRRSFEQLKVATQSYARALNAANALLLEEGALREAISVATTIASPACNGLVASFSSLLNSLPSIRDAVQGSIDVDGKLVEVAAELESKNAKFYELRKDQQHVNEALKLEETLRQTITTMEAVETELSDLKTKQAQLMARRKDLRSQRDALADELYALRLAQVEQINDEFGDQIVLTLEQGALTIPHKKLIEELLQRSNLRNQPEVASDLAEKVRVSDLVDIIEASDAKRLSEVLDRDLGQMTRLVSHLLDSSRLYELEEIVPEDNLEITMIVRGVARPISHLSKGQMATALLPLILRDAEYPLLFDQPEDDLDNAYISVKLIERLTELSKRRQLIFVTHNANIPVLGEADSVTVMEMEGPRKARPCQSGNVDEMKDAIIHILEGGKDAFNSRQQRYGAALG